MRGDDYISDFTFFLSDLRCHLKENQILSKVEDVELRALETSHHQNIPLIYLFPENTAQVQKIVLLANQYRINISASSTGINWGYGGNNPPKPGGAVLILERMNRVLEINKEQAYAVIEPGVTYQGFNAYLKAHGSDLWIDTTDGPPQASVLGNALDRGIGETPYGDHFGCICGMEVVLPTGEVIQTGGASEKRPLRTWHTHKWGVGPYVEGIFTQSNFGIVTRAGIWLMPKPEAYTSYVFEVDKERHLAAIIDRFHELALQGVVTSKLHLINDFVSLSIIRQRYQEDLPPGPIPPEKMANFRKKYSLAPWNMGGALYGKKEIVASQKKTLRRLLGGKGLFLFVSDRTSNVIKKLVEFLDQRPALGNIFETLTRRSVLMIGALPEVHGLLKGIPTSYFCNHCYFKVPFARPQGSTNPAIDGVGLTWFAPLLPFSSKDILPFIEKAKVLFAKHGFDFYMAMLMLNPRSMVCLMGILFDRKNIEETGRAEKLYDELMSMMKDSGYQQYRCGNAGFKMLFEDSEDYVTFLNAIKKGLDPNNILASGRYGIDGEAKPREAVAAHFVEGPDHNKVLDKTVSDIHLQGSQETKIGSNLTQEKIIRHVKNIYLPNPFLLPSLLREVFSKRTLQREPEPNLVMEDTAEVNAYVEGGKSNLLDATYLFVNSHLSQVIHGRRRVLDLGCGPATILCQIAKSNPSIEFVGVDLSASMIEQGNRAIQRLGLENVTLIQDDITTLSKFTDHSFDGVISTFALHHLPTMTHLQDCFKQIYRLLELGGAIFIFDFGRLKNIKSVIQMAYLNSEEDPYLFTLDKERSMRAAFTLKDFRRLSREFLPEGCQVYSTARVPLLVMIQTHPRPIPLSTKNYFNEQRNKLTPKYCAALDDIRFFFQLGGLKNDVFDSLIPVAGQMAKLKMLDFANLPVLRCINSSQFMRTLGVSRLVLRIISAFVNYQCFKFFNKKNADHYQGKFLKQLADAFKSELGALKGPFIKFGQMASYLTEDIPPMIRETLKPLQHSSPPLESKEIRKIVENELRQPISKLFKEWHDTPIAAASISQLHLARLPNDKLVVVKVRYPKILQAIRSDFLMLRRLSPLLKRVWGLSNIIELINELEDLITNECDFIKAGEFQEEFRHLFLDDPDIIIPKVYSDYSTSAVLTMDYIEGRSYEEFKKTSTQEEKNRAGLIMWRMAALSINRYCLYNADPHPGNYFFVGDKVAFIDFGFTKRFSASFMDLWKQQSITCCEGDIEGFIEINKRLGYEVPGKTFDHQALFDLYRGLIFDSWRTDSNFRFTKEFVDTEMRGLLGLYRSSQNGLRMPVEFVAILRLLWGQHTILADLGAEANWHAAVYPLLKENSYSLGKTSSMKSSSVLCL